MDRDGTNKGPITYKLAVDALAQGKQQKRMHELYDKSVRNSYYKPVAVRHAYHGPTRSPFETVHLHGRWQAGGVLPYLS